MNRDEYRTFGAILTAKRGNELPHSRLNPELVRDIRKNRYGWTAKTWAEALGVHIRTVEKVQRFDSWRHVRSA